MAAELTWTDCLRRGVFPQLSEACLTALRDGLAADSEEFIQGETLIRLNTSDAPGACCPLAYGIWRGDLIEEAYEIEDTFGRVCEEADKVLGEPGAIHPLINWIDTAPWPIVRPALLGEVEAEIERRETPQAKHERDRVKAETLRLVATRRG